MYASLQAISTILINTLAQAAPDASSPPGKVSQIVEYFQQMPWLSWAIAGFVVFAMVVAAVAALTGNLDKIFSFALKYFSRAETALPEQQLLTLRAALLKQMKQDVAQRLEDSLHNLVSVDLAREEQQRQVGRRTDALVKIEPKPVRPLHSLIKRGFAVFKSNQETVPVPAGEQTYRIFHRDDIGERLLILGEPGAGKTTELLIVAQRLVEEAIENDSSPVPILFELSSWTPDTPILEWLGKQLYQAYGVSKQLAEKLAHQWVQQNQILLLLDGLDELGQSSQVACIAALEDFLASHGALSALVCCRREEYEQGGRQLQQLKGAVYLQSLEPAQIRQYLKDLDREPLWKQIQGQSELLALAQRPLFLTMLVVAYQGQQIRDGAALFDAYIQKQLHDPNHQGTYRPGKGKTTEQTLHYLVWLARQLEQRSETEFLIENLQPDWLEFNRQRLTYRLIVGLINGLMIGLINGVIYGLMTGLLGELIFGMKGSLVDGLMVGLLFGLSGGLIFGLSVGLSGGLTEGLNKIASKSPMERPHPSYVIIFGLMDGLSKIVPKAKLELSPRGPSVVISMFGASFGLIGMLKGGLLNGLIHGLVGGLSGGLVFSLVGGMIFRLDDEAIEKKLVPNQGIRKSRRNGLIFGSSFGLLGGLSGGLISGSSGGLAFGLVSGLCGGLIFGLSSAIQHFILRILLTKNSHAPWNYEKFLEHVTRHRFIQRTGGRYRFVHDLLRQHFAQTTPQQQAALARPSGNNP